MIVTGGSGMEALRPFWTDVRIAPGSFLIGAPERAAQIPLYIWLPDAMAGPTPCPR